MKISCVDTVHPKPNTLPPLTGFFFTSKYNANQKKKEYYTQNDAQTTENAFTPHSLPVKHHPEKSSPPLTKKTYVL
jgi:hypothetical protein